MVVIPRVGRADAPPIRAEPVARLKAIAAHHGLTLFDLSDTFDRFDPAKLEIAAWDDHPNALGHRRLFLALARAMIKDQELCHLLFTPIEGSRTPKTAPAPGICSRLVSAKSLAGNSRDCPDLWKPLLSPKRSCFVTKITDFHVKLRQVRRPWNYAT